MLNYKSNKQTQISSR